MAMTISSLFLASIPLSAAFLPQVEHGACSSAYTGASALHMETAVSVPTRNPIHDPLGLYPENAPERAAGLIEPLERPAGARPDVLDPLRLYPARSPEVAAAPDMSPSLPFAPRPALLDGTLPGDRGFDPLNFAADAGTLQWQREAELKHARIAMLAAVGWPLAELCHGGIANALALPNLLASGDRVPSVLNDGLAHAPFPAFWVAAVGLAAALEIRESVDGYLSFRINTAKTTFDLFNPYDKQMHFMLEAELFNGRLGMLAVTGYAIQEWCTGSAVVHQVPILFQPIHLVLEHMASV